MNINELKQLSYDDVRSIYKSFLNNQGLGPNTINTAYADTFYLWRKEGPTTFWNAMEGSDEDARRILLAALSKHSSSDPYKLVHGYLSHIRRFRLLLASKKDFVPSQSSTPSITPRQNTLKHKPDFVIPSPSPAQVDYYLAKWDTLENYRLQENALDKLFFTLAPSNTEISDILLKASTLNDFYSTNIFSIFPVAKHILSLNIDARLKAGDVTLVKELQTITIGGKARNYYSFATKYCSHHNPLDFPIYDSYVAAVLRYFKKLDRFSTFQDDDLKDYIRFKNALLDFRSYYGLSSYTLKQIDKYLWLLGKEYFPKNYTKKSSP